MEFIAMLNRDSINNLVEGDRIALTFCLGNLYMRRNLFAWQICFFFHLTKKNALVLRLDWNTFTPVQ